MKSLKKSTRFVFGLLMILAMFSAYLPSVEAAEKKAHEMVRVPIFTAPMGTGFYSWWAIFERIFEENHEWLRLAVQESPGFTYNLQMMAKKKKRWEKVIYSTNKPVRMAAEHAVEPFFKEPIHSANWKFLFPGGGCAAMTYWWVTLDPKITTMRDFEGKRLGLGLQSQISYGTIPTVAVKALGLQAKLEYLGPLQAIDALLDGRVDVAIGNGWYPVGKAPDHLKPRIATGMQRLLASGRDFYYVSYNDWIEPFKQQKGYSMVRSFNIKPGSLPKQDKEIVAINTLPTGHAVHETFPDELAYEFTKFLIKHGNKLAAYSKMGEFFIIPEGALSESGFTEDNTHPGAIRAFKEAGVWN